MPVDSSDAYLGPAARMDMVGCVQIDVNILPILKKQLLDEHDAINIHNKFLALPRQPTAMEVLNQFVLHGGNSRCTNAELRQLATGLEEYLDKVLESKLLYKPEWEDAGKVGVQQLVLNLDEILMSC